MQYGGFWRRVVAYLIDGIVLNIVLWLVFSLLGFNVSAFLMPDTATGEPVLGAGYLMFQLVSLVGSWLYFALMESSSKQATLGKMALGMVVTETDGSRISFMRATGRYFAKIISALILLIGFIMVAFTERKQGLHDMIASTLVVKGTPGTVVNNAEVFS